MGGFTVVFLFAIIAILFNILKNIAGIKKKME